MIKIILEIFRNFHISIQQTKIIFFLNGITLVKHNVAHALSMDMCIFILKYQNLFNGLIQLVQIQLYFFLVKNSIQKELYPARIVDIKQLI